MTRDTEHYLIDTADHCAQLARAGRELAERLEAMSNHLMAKAVELDTAREHEEKPLKARKMARK